MGNIVSLHAADQESGGWLRMSNGATSLVMSLLVLGGSALARNRREEELVAWLAGRDQSIMGQGVVGFHLDELPWTSTGFEAERSFLIRAVEAGRDRAVWEKLDWDPDPVRLDAYLDLFRGLFERFEPRWTQKYRRAAS